MDERMRQLARQAAQGDVEAEQALLRIRLRAGLCNHENAWIDSAGPDPNKMAWVMKVCCTCGESREDLEIPFDRFAVDGAPAVDCRLALDGSIEVFVKTTLWDPQVTGIEDVPVDVRQISREDQQEVVDILQQLADDRGDGLSQEIIERIRRSIR